MFGLFKPTPTKAQLAISFCRTNAHLLATAAGTLGISALMNRSTRKKVDRLGDGMIEKFVEIDKFQKEQADWNKAFSRDLDGSLSAFDKTLREFSKAQKATIDTMSELAQNQAKLGEEIEEGLDELTKLIMKNSATQEKPATTSSNNKTSNKKKKTHQQAASS